MSRGSEEGSNGGPQAKALGGDVLVEAGYTVRAAHRASSNLRWLRNQPLETALVDLADPTSLDAFLAGCCGLVHCAGALMADERIYQRVNVDGTRLVAEAAARFRRAGEAL